jgi:serine protease AprX
MITLWNHRWRTSTLVALLGLVFATPALAQVESAQHDKLDEAVREALYKGGRVRAIVRFTDEASRVRGYSKLLGRGGRVGRSLNDVGGLTVVAEAAALDELAADSGVARISTDAPVHAGAFSFVQGGRQPRTSGALAARKHAGRHGAGVAVAIIDSGVQPHADLPASRIRAFVDFVNGRTAPYDDFGHGTHVAGIVAGSGAASAGLDDPYQGVAPDVDIVALKVLDGTGAGTTSDVIGALEWVAVNHRAYNIRVVNLSLGHPVFEPAATDPLVQAAEALTRRGIVVVASVGNLGLDPRDNKVGYGGVTSPANGASIIAVGGVDTQGTDVRSDDRVTDYSSRGPTRFDLRAKPDLVAPSHRVVSLASPASHLFDRYPHLQVWGGSESVPAYFTLSGTSMAAPVVSGAAALLFNASPSLSASSVRAVLEFTSQRLADVDGLAQGAGYVNVLGAVRLAGLVNPRAPLGAFWLRQRMGPDPFDMLFGEQVVWSKSIVWGDRLLTGDSVYLHMAAWDDILAWGQFDNIVWGPTVVRSQLPDFVLAQNIMGGQNGVGLQNIVWGYSYDVLDNIVWGDVRLLDDVVWADNLVWSENIVWGYWAQNIVWGYWDDGVVWGQVSRQNADDIAWGNDYLDDIDWGQDADNGRSGQNIVLGYNLAVLTGEMP